MPKSWLLLAAIALVVAGAAIGGIAARRPWAASAEHPDARRAADIAALRTEAGDHAARLSRLESSSADSGALGRLRAAAEDQSARITKLEQTAATTSPVRQLLEDLKAIPDGSRTVAIRDALASLARLGDAAVPEIESLLGSGFDRAYGGGLLTRGNAVSNWPSLRLVLCDALRQIGTPAARDALVRTFTRTDCVADAPAVWMFWEGGAKGPADPALGAALSKMTTTLLTKVAADGLETADCDTTNGAGVSIVFWAKDHPREEDGPAFERLALRGRPKDPAAAEMFTQAFRVFVDVAPEKAARTAVVLQQRAPEGWEIVGLSDGVGNARRTSQLRYFETLFAQPDVESRIRCQLYDMYVPRCLDDRIAEPAARVAEAEPLVRFLEARVNAETDEGCKASAAKALAQLREAIDQAQKQVPR